ncbi:hypothetical protein N7532_007328 [Penicillium argentinense]|uniref:Uncharacterized protein n=1 Tax=Penicillium argentinense TaxID=1131581 RepID=A0A9W9F7H7_9EURO|nr:uncharacterized protein N7532_007328 [Penicillium argentinense]KAJ5095037.1 hypothetical protein N7532_007328 [Penicillium argentinense]
MASNRHSTARTRPARAFRTMAALQTRDRLDTPRMPRTAHFRPGSRFNGDKDDPVDDEVELELDLTNCDGAFEIMAASSNTGLFGRAPSPQPQVHPPRIFTDPSSTRSFDQLRQDLAEPMLRDSTRRLFEELTDMILRVERKLFSGPGEFLDNESTLDVLEFAQRMQAFFSSAASLTEELVNVSERVSCMMAVITRDCPDAMWRFQWMTILLWEHQPKPRLPEFNVIKAMGEFWTEAVYDKYTVLYHDICQGTGGTLNTDNAHFVAGSVGMIMSTLSRLYRAYGEYVNRLRAIQVRHFDPLTRGLNNEDLIKFRREMEHLPFPTWN